MNLPFDWPDRVPAEQWEVYDRVIHHVQDAGIEFALGGAVALGAYTGIWRNTKDMDLYIAYEDRERMIEALSRAGLSDYYDKASYDRRWIYRACTGDTIVDAIWAMANQRAVVDRDWVRRGCTVETRGLRLKVLPPEELIWSKLYVMQRERCDWPDILNVLDATAPYLDWNRLAERVGEDRPLLAGVLSVYRWLCPANAAMVPLLDGERNGHVDDKARQDLLDSRPWFRGADPAAKRQLSLC